MVIAPLWLLLGMVTGTALAFEDDEACLMCHKYPLMGRVTDDGVLRSYYVMPHVFKRTVHRNVPCRDCHTDIKELPHKPSETGVTCNAECHSIKNPATGERFSHKEIYKSYIKSTHGREKHEKGTDADKPYCISCHTNPLYNPKEDAPPTAIINRCVVCHEKREFAERWYNHTSRRIREVRRSPQEIVELCLSCHGDKELVDKRMDLAKQEDRKLGKKFPFAAESYLESFHGKMSRYGFNKAANCLDCHAREGDYYRSVHEIRPSRDPVSPTHKDNKVETCKRCHIHADENYAELDPHPTSHQQDNVFRYYAELIYNIVGDIVIVLLVGISLFETWGRRRDGAAWCMKMGTSWCRKSKRGRDRII
ncbi:MAG: cytochrome c3 family protein [Gammaproteobacteria bacterium]|nr:cytochrome c3 family protein [Gammaproteobacteria bacterium]